MDSWQEPQTLATYLLIVLVFVFILISAIIVAVRISLKKTLEANDRASKLKLEHQRKLLENSILTQERERARIAADIHDELIGKLTVIKMTNQMNENTQDLDALISSSIDIARQISHDLIPPLIEYSSLEELIRETMLPWQQKIAVDMSFNIAEDLRVSSNIKIHFVRIIQEVLVNTIKHSKADLVALYLRVTPQWIAMNISDNGIGFDLGSVKPGLGLSNIETRIQYMKGRFKLRSAPNRSTRYTFLVPTVLEIQDDEAD